MVRTKAQESHFSDISGHQAAWRREGQFDKLVMKVKPLSYKGQGIEVSSGDKKNWEKMHAEHS